MADLSCDYAATAGWEEEDEGPPNSPPGAPTGFDESSFFGSLSPPDGPPNKLAPP